MADLREAHTKTVDGLMVALVGFGRVVERPWAGNGMLTFRPVVVATLAADHRVSDGHRGSRLPVALDADLREAVDLDSLDVLADYLLTRTDGG